MVEILTADSDGRERDSEGGDASRPGGTTGDLKATVIHAAAFALAIGVSVATWAMLRPLALLFAAAVVAAAVSPLIARLERWSPRLLAILAIYLAAFAALVAILWLVLPSLVSQAQSLITGGPDLIDRARAWLAGRTTLPLDIEQVAGTLSSSVDAFAAFLVSLPFRILSAATEILVVTVMSMYWLIAAPALRRFVLSLVPESRQPDADSLIGEICWTMGGYVRGLAVDMLILGGVVYVGLRLLGVQYAFVLALLAGASPLVPIVGPIIAALPALAVAWSASPVRAFAVLLFYLIVHHVESDLLLPNLLKNQARIPPLLVLFALVAAAGTGSVLAVLIAIPLAGALRVVTLRVAAPGIQQWTGATGAGEDRMNQDSSAPGPKVVGR